MNKAIFIGNLARDPELKVMQNGKPRCTFTVAVSRPYTNSQGGRDADFIGMVAYDKNAENAQKYLSKGRKVAVECHVKTGSYENSEGKRVYTTEFIIDHLEFISSNSQGQAQSQATEQPTAARHGESGYESQGFIQGDDNELPF